LHERRRITSWSTLLPVSDTTIWTYPNVVEDGAGTIARDHAQLALRLEQSPRTICWRKCEVEHLTARSGWVAGTVEVGGHGTQLADSALAVTLNFL